MIQALIAGFFANFVFELVNGTRSLDRFDFSASGANQVIAVYSGLKQGEIGGAFMEAEAADYSVFGEALQ